MTPVREALKGSPTLDGRGLCFHLLDSVVLERWFVEIVYKQMTSLVDLTLPHQWCVLRQQSLELGGEVRLEGRTAWLRTDRLENQPQGGRWPLIRKLRHEFWERKMVIHWETCEPNGSTCPWTWGTKIWIKWLAVRWWYCQVQVSLTPSRPLQGDSDERGLGILRIVLLQKPR